MALKPRSTSRKFVLTITTDGLSEEGDAIVDRVLEKITDNVDTLDTAFDGQIGLDIELINTITTRHEGTTPF